MGMNRESTTSQLEHFDLACAYEVEVTSASNSRNNQGNLGHKRALRNDDDVIYEEFSSKISFDGVKVAKIDSYSVFCMNVEMNRQVFQVKKRMHT